MPTVRSEEALAKVYWAAKKKLDAGEVPTLPIYPDQTFYRSFNPKAGHSALVKPAPGGILSRSATVHLLAPPDGANERGNRFSGPSVITALHSAAPITPLSGPSAGISSSGGVYCVMQQQALVNESTHYSRKVPLWALAGRCVIRIRSRQLFQVADVSPHNPGGRRFLRSLGASVWDEMNDLKDCSVARGIGLAVAQCSYLSGMVAQTVRESDRSAEERGDSVILFGPQGVDLSYPSVDEAQFYGNTYTPQIFPVV